MRNSKGQFVKGHKPNNTPEVRAKISAKLKGRISPMLGRYHSEETINRIKLSNIGKNKGFRHSEKTRRTIGDKLRGSKSHLWKGGITPINEKIRKSVEYKLWRTSVFERDNYTCVWCGKNHTYLQADHIKPFAYFPELRFAIDNGRTLCVPCHKKTDTYMGRGRWLK